MHPGGADYNNDGYVDLAFGGGTFTDSYNSRSNAGRVWVFYGSNSGWSANPSCVFTGAQATGYFGVSLPRNAGDFNGDGYDDLAVGSHNYTNGSTNEGAVFVYYGSAGGLAGCSATGDDMASLKGALSTTASLIIESNTFGGGLGYAVDYINPNNDAYSDIFGGTFASSGIMARVYSQGSTPDTTADWTGGSSGATYNGGASGGGFGYSGGDVGDVNGGGRSDLAIGEFAFDSGGGLNNNGKVHLFFGTGVGAGLANTASVVFTGAYNNGEFGAEITGAKLNNDSYSDLIVGSPKYSGGQTNEGRVDVFFGGSSGPDTTSDFSWESNVGSTYVGGSIAAVDTGADGYAELFISSHHRVSANSGVASQGIDSVYVIPSNSSGPTTLKRTVYLYWQGGGSTVADLGDTNGDGFRDLAFGTHVFWNSHSNEGRVSIYRGGPDPDGDTYVDAEDCFPNNATFNPSYYEGTDINHVADGIDQNCDGVDTCYWDSDNDGFAPTSGYWLSSGSTLDCVADANVAAVLGDCDGFGGPGDSNANIHPNATEVVNTYDDNCDTKLLCYVDGDGDGKGISSTILGPSNNYSCYDAGEAPNDDNDCNDGNSSIYVGATETLNDGIDQDCDTKDLCVLDQDQDNYGAFTVNGFGNSVPTTVSGDPAGADATPLVCSDNVGSTNEYTDCNDASAAMNPGKTEILVNGIDDDCNGYEACYSDIDGDGVGRSDGKYPSFDMDCTDLFESSEPDCEDPIDYNCDGSTGMDDLDSDGAPACQDCDDSDPTRYPSAEEICNGEDDDCDGDFDEDSVDAPEWYVDADQDGFGDDTTVLETCTPPEGVVSVGGDCDDSDPNYHPEASESDCEDPNDYNCDGSVAWGDDDEDGAANCEDCADDNDGVFPGAAESCNGADDNCDGAFDEGFVNTDGDFFADCVDPDDDNDGLWDENDEHPLDPDADGNGVVDGFDAAADESADANACSTAGVGLSWPAMLLGLVWRRRRATK